MNTLFLAYLVGTFIAAFISGFVQLEKDREYIVFVLGWPWVALVALGGFVLGMTKRG